MKKNFGKKGVFCGEWLELCGFVGFGLIFDHFDQSRGYLVSVERNQ